MFLVKKSMLTLGGVSPMAAEMVDDVMSLVSEADAVLLEYLKGKQGLITMGITGPRPP